MADPRLGKVALRESYVAIMRNAEGAGLFRNLYLNIGGVPRDVLRDGERSCAFFVSAVLHLFFLIETPHATVSGLERDLKTSGWYKTDVPREGDIIFWEPKLQNGEMNAHAGFYLGDNKALSNSTGAGKVMKHHITYETNIDGTPARSIVAIYTHDSIRQ